MGKRKNTADAPSVDTTAWMVTFGDLLMLLLTFFVLLLSMSSMDVKSLRSMFSLFMGASGPLELTESTSVEVFEGDVHSNPGPLEGLGMEESVAPPDLIEMIRYVLDLKQFGGTRPFSGDDFIDNEDDYVRRLLERHRDAVRVGQDERGVVITFDEAVLFGPGSAALQEESLPVLRTISEILVGISNRILVIGHSDNVPMKGAGAMSNWDLSLARALSVQRYLLEVAGVRPDRFGVGGYGDTCPQFSNDTREGREKNRRVEIVLTK